MAIVQQMFPASLDGSYWFAEYHATEDNNNRALFMGTLALDPAGFIYTSGMYRKYGTGYQGRFGREFHLFHTKHTPSSDCIFLKRRRHHDNWEFAVEQSVVNTNGDYIVYPTLLFHTKQIHRTKIKRKAETNLSTNSRTRR